MLAPNIHIRVLSPLCPCVKRANPNLRSASLKQSREKAACLAGYCLCKPATYAKFGDAVMLTLRTSEGLSPSQPCYFRSSTKRKKFGLNSSASWNKKSNFPPKHCGRMMTGSVMLKLLGSVLILDPGLGSECCCLQNWASEIEIQGDVQLLI